MDSNRPASAGNAAIELTAVVVAVTDNEPRVLTVGGGLALPSGPFESGHRTLQSGLREWVELQTRHPLGYAEQLYTFADRDRTGATPGGRVISISYLGLSREVRALGGAEWRNWYSYFPWEDWRRGAPPIIAEAVMPGLLGWAGKAKGRRQRIELAFERWNEELVLQRYELLFEAGLVPEAAKEREVQHAVPGLAMAQDHRRILATAIARLRAKIKYRPVVFELMPPSFTLLRLQRTMEAVAGLPLHKQNFRRLIDQQGLVEETGEVSTEAGGRPARLVRFRREVLEERAIGGTKLPLSRS